MGWHEYFAIGATAAWTAFMPVAGLAACDVHSGAGTAALIELYTSEGCSSCPPADLQLRNLRQALDPAAQAVPLALHVGYWDYLGWKDAFAKETFATRQNWLLRVNHQRIAYTPQFFVGGTELRSWQGALNEHVRQINSRPAAAQIRLRANLSANGALAVDAEATARTEASVLYLALAENGLASRVTRGENGGTTLAHDHVVREWLGPVRLAGGAARIQKQFALPAEWNRSRLELVSFVQDERSGSVLQAVGAQHCAAS